MRAKLKNILLILLLVFCAAVINSVFSKLGYPVLLSDLLLSAIAVFVIILSLNIVSKARVNAVPSLRNAPSLYQSIGGGLLLLLLFLCSGWLVFLGVKEPFGVFGGVAKPSAHGYTVAIIGISISAFCAAALYNLIRSRLKRRD